MSAQDPSLENPLNPFGASRLGRFGWSGFVWGHPTRTMGREEEPGTRESPLSGFRWRLCG